MQTMMYNINMRQKIHSMEYEHAQAGVTEERNRTFIPTPNFFMYQILNNDAGV